MAPSSRPGSVAPVSESTRVSAEVPDLPKPRTNTRVGAAAEPSCPSALGVTFTLRTLMRDGSDYAPDARQFSLRTLMPESSQ